MIEGLLVGLGAFGVIVGIIVLAAWLICRDDDKYIKDLEKWRDGK